MQPTPAMQPATPAAGSSTWARVQDVVGPLAGTPTGLFVHGADLGPAEPTRTGVRMRPIVPAGGTGDFGTYCNAFPAGQWRSAAGVRAVRLRIRVDAVALLTVHRSDASGSATAGEQRLLAAHIDEVFEIALDTAADGLLWFDLQAGLDPVGVLDAAWEVRERPRPGGLVIGTPTVGRVGDVAANLARIAAAPALTAVVDRVLVVDHAGAPLEQELRAAVGDALGERLRVVRQPNLGGSGGYSRVMHEALAEPGAQAVLLLDDDIVAEPAALLKAFEFARRTAGSDIVGLQMLDAARPAVLEAGAEHIVGRTFWWAPVDAALPGTDVALPVRGQPSLHRSDRADFAGWWGALIPLDVVRAVGYAMPFFLKWDDAEYALRAREAGYRTISLQGAAVWHESWRTKDDARTWPAYFHARNRLLAALLHGSDRVRTGVLVASLAVEVKQLLALHGFAVERRQEGVRAVLAGPAALESAGVDELARLRGLDQAPVSRSDAEAVPESQRPATAAPRGGGLAVWTVVLLLRHLLAPVTGSATRLPADRGTWWTLPWFDDVLTPTADGAGYFRLVRDRRRFRTALATSVALHARLWLAWPSLARRYRSAAPVLAAPEAWRERFAAGR